MVLCKGVALFFYFADSTDSFSYHPRNTFAQYHTFFLKKVILLHRFCIFQLGLRLAWKSLCAPSLPIENRKYLPVELSVNRFKFGLIKIIQMVFDT